MGAPTEHMRILVRKRRRNLQCSWVWRKQTQIKCVIRVREHAKDLRNTSWQLVIGRSVYVSATIYCLLSAAKEVFIPSAFRVRISVVSGLCCCRYFYFLWNCFATSRCVHYSDVWPTSHFQRLHHFDDFFFWFFFVLHLSRCTGVIIFACLAIFRMLGLFWHLAACLCFACLWRLVTGSHFSFVVICAQSQFVDLELRCRI